MKAIVIGAGPSIFEKNHLEILSKSNFNGYIMSCDRILKYTLECGITPVKFSNYYTATINDCIITHKAWHEMELFFNHQIIKDHAKNIKCFVSSQVHPKQIEYLSKIGFDVAGYYHQYGKTKLYAVPKNKSLELKDCDNVCMALWSLAKNYFSCSKIAFLGVDLSYSEYDTELYKGNNPTWDSHLSCMLQELQESHNIKSYNCTQGGRLHGPGIIDSTLDNFLNL